MADEGKIIISGLFGAAVAALARQPGINQLKQQVEGLGLTVGTLRFQLNGERAEKRKLDSTLSQREADLTATRTKNAFLEDQIARKNAEISALKELIPPDVLRDAGLES